MIEITCSVELFVWERLTKNVVPCTAVSVDKRVRTLRNMMNYGVSHSSTHIEPAGTDTRKHLVLTLPAFQWVLANGVSRAPFPTKQGNSTWISQGHSGTRIGHTCHVVGHRQFLSIGGVNPSQGDKWSVPDTNNIQGLGTFDLTNLSWQSSYQAKAAPYQRSQLVQSVYNTKCVLNLVLRR